MIFKPFTEDMLDKIENPVLVNTKQGDTIVCELQWKQGNSDNYSFVSTTLGVEVGMYNIKEVYFKKEIALKEVQIEDLSIKEIEKVLTDIQYGEDHSVSLYGKFDFATAEKIEVIDKEDEISLIHNTWMTSSTICIGNDGVSEQFKIKDLSKALYEIEQSYK